MGILHLNEEEQNDKFSSKDINITVVGLGKMGLPIAMVFTHAGYTVKGLDISETLVEQLNQGQTLLTEEPFVVQRLKQAITGKIFSATTNVSDAVSNADFIIFIIPVLTTDTGEANIEILQKTYSKINNFTPSGCIYIQESTLPPLTTKNKLKPILEQNDKVSGKDFGLVFSPERTFSGRAIQDIEDNYPKLIGGDTPNAANIASKLYTSVCKKGTIILSNSTTAEAVKTFKGAYRDANIAIANELAILADYYSVDILEVINAANTEPFSHIHTPGMGVGGHCIPVYPQFLIAEGKKYGYSADVLSNSRIRNNYMVYYALEQLEKIQGFTDSTVL
ncbi:MAG: nucleotide sugar dehydrogenase, partial [Candidatus Heimdallarchaeota archaeon]|nr:nucleotide sugar dehydrogenase [Candidatus Heimdallarchaeota archaeon]